MTNINISKRCQQPSHPRKVLGTKTSVCVCATWSIPKSYQIPLSYHFSIFFHIFSSRISTILAGANSQEEARRGSCQSCQGGAWQPSLRIFCGIMGKKVDRYQYYIYSIWLCMYIYNYIYIYVWTCMEYIYMYIYIWKICIFIFIITCNTHLFHCWNHIIPTNYR